MLLRNLLSECEFTLQQGSLDIDIRDVVYDSRKECRGALFVCIRGTKRDSHDLIPEVLEKGAAAFVTDRPVEVPVSVTVVMVENPRLALAQLSAALFGHPTRRMRTIGITGTKGKTSTTFMIRRILEEAGKKVGLIGTNGAEIAGKHYKTLNTTPESYELQHYFRMMADAGCEYMIMEVSSQGLMMNRVAGFDFDIAVFTNISPDHIGPGEHADFHEYLECKRMLFALCRKGLINVDDPHAEEIMKGHTCEIYTCSCEHSADFWAKNIENVLENGTMGVRFDYRGRGKYPVELSVPGRFSVYNAVEAIGVAELLYIPKEAICRALRDIHVDGRMELVHSSAHCAVIVDYAHNGIATESLLTALRRYEPKRLVVVFGCGGNRDPHRRYEMGAAAGKMADLSVITADNSRDEAVEDIMRDIHIGLDPTGGAAIDIPDRREAIRYSIEHSEPGDVIAVIGKGHEDYQEIKGVRTHFSDREEIEKVLADLGWDKE